jgi:hypothetical protein
MLPILVPEHQICIFSFYFGGKMHKGTCHAGELYCKLEDFDISQRAKVYELGCKLANAGNQVMISSASRRYRIWVSLRSPYYSKVSTDLLEASSCA